MTPLGSLIVCFLSVVSSRPRASSTTAIDADGDDEAAHAEGSGQPAAERQVGHRQEV